MKRRQVIKAICQAAVGGAVATVAGTALARIGRPLTPVSVAGVRRRTRRRTRRRMYYMTPGMTIYGLPPGCGGMVPYGGVNMHYCGGIYYRPVYQGTTVVYVVDKVEPGANTQVEIEEPY
ncbi:MAG: hypothetical protein V7709_06595 [Halioglobus sp.]